MLNQLIRTSKEPQKTWWKSFTGLKPLDEEHELIMPQSYDGIVELDNPTPPWFMFLFYSTILFALVYGFYYHVYTDAHMQENEYRLELAIAKKERAIFMKKFANSVNEDNVSLLRSKEDLVHGAKIYKSNCIACHGEIGQGGVGPNLTDPYWIHGGKIKDLFKTISEGVPEKGMIAWQKTLNPLQIQLVSSYIISMQGSNPPGAKEPHGEKLEVNP